MKAYTLISALAASFITTLGAYEAHASCLTTAQAQSQVSSYAASHAWIGSPTPTNAISWQGNGWLQHYTNNQNPTIWISQCDNTGPHIVQGLIEGHYAALGGGGTSPFGYPVSDEVATPSNDGRVSYFESGGIFWASGVGTFGVHGWIWQKYYNMGTTVSGLGYPTSDEQAYSGAFSGRFNSMQDGWMVFNASASPFDWMHATWPIFDWPHPNDPQLHVMGWSTGTDQFGGTVQVQVSGGMGANANVQLFLDNWSGRFLVASGKTSANGYFLFPEIYFDNNEAGGGDSSGFIVTLEVVSSTGAFEAIGVEL